MEDTERKMMQRMYHLSPPTPYDERLSLDKIPLDFVSVAAIRREIGDDPSLSPEQKTMLQHELSDRYRAVLLGQAGEGFND